jgi:hypothetical protein
MARDEAHLHCPELMLANAERLVEKLSRVLPPQGRIAV